MLRINFSEFENLQDAMKAYTGNTEAAINEVLHGKASEILEAEIYRLMPVSGRKWKGKKPAAKSAKSLMSSPGNLSITVRTTKNYQYLYFPDDGTNTKRHAGNKQFFFQSGDNKKSEIVDRCITRLIEEIEN
jgi:hypothetical protein